MKKIFYTAIAFVSCLFLGTSCVDLDQYPQGFITEEEYVASLDVDALQKAVTALYNNFRGTNPKGKHDNYGFNCRLQAFNVGADDITCSPTKANNRLTYFENLSPSSSANNADVETTWRQHFNVINNSNKLITNVVIPEGKDKEKYQQAMGEAYFIRALSYFYLVRLFGDLPLILTTSDATNNMPRSSVADIYDKAIVPSLTQAIAWLPTTSRSGDSSTPSQWAAKACLADVYMTMAGWPLKKGQEYYTKAADLLKDIKDHSHLQLTLKYEDLWKEDLKTEANEHMFAIHHSQPNGTASNYGISYYPADYITGGWSDYYGTKEFYLNYPDDNRKKWNYMTEWQNKAKEVITFEESTDRLPAISKYYDYDGKGAQSNGITPIYRYADVLLMYAEASTRATGTVNAEALKCLQEIQIRAGYKTANLTTTTDPTAFEAAVFNECGWEFFAEMKRWFDLVRLEKVSEVRANAWNNSLFHANNHYYMPIPEGQILLTNGWTNNAGY